MGRAFTKGEERAARIGKEDVSPVRLVSPVDPPRAARRWFSTTDVYIYSLGHHEHRLERGPRAAAHTVRRAALAPADDPAGPRARAADGRVLLFSWMHARDDRFFPVHESSFAVGTAPRRPVCAVSRRWRPCDTRSPRRRRRDGPSKSRDAPLHAIDATPARRRPTGRRARRFHRRTCRAARLFFWCSATWPRRSSACPSAARSPP